jgi:virulence-associated protein VagC
MSDIGVAKIFVHGRSQAVRLPLAFWLSGDRVRVRRVGRGILLEPMVTDLESWFAELDRFADVPSWRKAGGSLRCRRLEGCSSELYPRHQCGYCAAPECPPAVRDRLRQVASEGASIAVSSVVLFELWYGVARSSRRHENAECLRVFLSGDIDVVPFGDEDALTAAIFAQHWKRSECRSDLMTC